MHNKEEILNNGVFCVLPWTHFGTTATGRVRPCSWGTKFLMIDDKEYNVLDHNIQNHKDITPIKELKQKMLQGIKSDFCSRCYEQEASTGTSKRMTETFNLQKHNTEKILDGEDVPIKELELRLGNLCNIGCIGCNTRSSNFFVKEIKKNDADISKFDKKFARAYNAHNDKNNDWINDTQFWQNIESHLSNLEYIYIAGGEPTIVEKNWEFLEKVIELGYADKIKLGLSSNLTNMQDRHIEIYNSFKTVWLYCSIDGYKEVNDYIRYPSKWKAISKNFEKLVVRCNENVKIKVLPVISIFSIWKLYELRKYIEHVEKKYNKRLLFTAHTLLRDPDWQSLVHMPLEAKKEAIEIIDKIAKEFVEKDVDQWDKVKTFIETETDTQETFYSGEAFAENFDSMRNIKWQDAIPELRRYWND